MDCRTDRLATDYISMIRSNEILIMTREALGTDSAVKVTQFTTKLQLEPIWTDAHNQ